MDPEIFLRFKKRNNNSTNYKKIGLIRIPYDYYVGKNSKSIHAPYASKLHAEGEGSLESSLGGNGGNEGFEDMERHIASVIVSLKQSI